MRNDFAAVLTLVVCLSLSRSAFAAVEIPYVPVGNPVNPGDPSSTYGTRGIVAKAYASGKYEVTNAQYAEFLNTVDPAGAGGTGWYANLCMRHRPAIESW